MQKDWKNLFFFFHTAHHLNFSFRIWETKITAHVVNNRDRILRHWARFRWCGPVWWTIRSLTFGLNVTSTLYSLHALCPKQISRYCAFSVKYDTPKTEKRNCVLKLYIFKRLHGQILYRVWGLLIRHPFNMGLNKPKHFSKLDSKGHLIFYTEVGWVILKHIEISTDINTVF